MVPLLFLTEKPVILLSTRSIYPNLSKLALALEKGDKYEDGDEIIRSSDNGLYTPLNGESNGISKGREKTQENEDIPKLRDEDRAESCHGKFLEQLRKQKQIKPSSQSSVLKTIILFHWKEISLSGLFALLKILTTSAGPLLLNAFIRVAKGNESSEHEGTGTSGAGLLV
ncbi:putative xenobiotic-transporting ATPase [Rosa chinensis]|uniref:Putative xenobiotic-transporting ATPase n=1 Tax=Rosa chinensis TaxID=74649 RepID=A0A2P6QCX1_ROSCH|nr:putative xenobiotic-transporting ATPase [Rosa chinensis]